MRRRKRDSRRSTKPTRSSRTSRSARPTTAWAMRRSNRAALRRRRRRRLRLNVRHLRGSLRRCLRGSPWRRTEPWRRPALQHGDLAGGSLQRQIRDDQGADRDHLRDLQRHRREARHQAQDLLHCKGQGRVAPARASSRSSAPAPPARGRGEVIEEGCPKCGGAGRVTRERQLSVNIPAGVEDGTRIRLAHEGEAGRARRPVGRPLHFHQPQAARLSTSATGPISSAACRSRW